MIKKLTKSQKEEIFRYYDNGNKRIIEVANHFSMAESTVSRIISIMIFNKIKEELSEKNNSFMKKTSDISEEEMLNPKYKNEKWKI